MMTINLGGKIILAGTVDKKAVEDHLRGFDNGLTILSYMLNSAKTSAAGSPDAVKTIENALEVIQTLKASEEDRYKRFYGLA